MDFLIDPNISYVLLVSGFLVAVLALLAPGTGIIEIAALFAIAVAGYGLANLPLNLWAILIMLAGIIPFFLLYRRPIRRQVMFITLSSIVFVVGSAFLYRGANWLPGVSFWLIVLLIPVVAGFTWLVAGKSLEAMHTRPLFNPDHLVGMTGQASSDIKGQGSIYVNGEEWSARSQAFIPAGSRVRVLARNGLVLEVEAADGV